MIGLRMKTVTLINLIWIYLAMICTARHLKGHHHDNSDGDTWIEVTKGSDYLEIRSNIRTSLTSQSFNKASMHVLVARVVQRYDWNNTLVTDVSRVSANKVSLRKHTPLVTVSGVPQKGLSTTPAALSSLNHRRVHAELKVWHSVVELLTERADSCFVVMNGVTVNVMMDVVYSGPQNTSGRAILQRRRRQTGNSQTSRP